MSFVQLAGNRIGQNGGEALALAMGTSTRRDGNLVVGMMDCDTSREDEKLLSVANATGEYDLDLQALSRQSKLLDHENGDYCDVAASSFFKALFIFADKEDKCELVIDDFVMLFQTLQLPYSEARMRHVMCKYDTDHSGSIDLEEFTHYMAAAHVKQPLVQQGALCTEDWNE